MTMTGLSPAPVAQTSGEANPPPTPLEMQNISSETTGILGETDSLQEPRKPTGHMPPGPARMDTTTALAQATSILEPPIEAESTVSPVSAAPAALVNRERAYSSAIGPSTDSPSIPLKDPEITGPVLLITLLLTNGARHPYRLDSGYLKKRSANVHNDDPYNLSVYKLKELILRDWRDDWEQKPSSPGAIRLISFGKLLEDKSALRELKFSHDGANVVHMTIKPQDLVDEEDAKAGKSSKAHRDDGMERTPGCRCIVM